MTQINVEKLECSLSKSFGLDLQLHNTGEGLKLRLTDLDFGEGFQIAIKHEWRYLSAEFIPENFAGELLRAMNRVSESVKGTFISIWHSNAAKYNEVRVEVNGRKVDELDTSIFDEDWLGLKIKLSKTSIYREEMSMIEYENELLNIFQDILGFVLILIPVEETVMDDTIVFGLPEGALSRVSVNRYERSHINRQTCLNYRGYNCSVCEFDFEKKYGVIGHKYIHVHHITPISQLGSNYCINPIKDLVPVCPNCHAMIHQKNPPLTVKELKDILKED